MNRAPTKGCERHVESRAMSYDATTHRRRSVRLKGYDYASAGAYFVTVCTHERICTLGAIEDGVVQLSDQGRITQQVMTSLEERFPSVAVDAFVVMPNHVHAVIILVGTQFIASDGRSDGSRRPILGEVIRTFKAVSTRLIRGAGDESFGWQRSFYEHVVRSDADVRRIREYVEANPLRWDEDPENPAIEQQTEPDLMTGHLRAR
jgi:REP-associated tyrosine transposase